MEDFRAKCVFDNGDSIDVSSDRGRRVGVALVEDDISAAVQLSSADTRRLRDWLTAWLSEQDEEPEEDEDPEGDGEALGLGIPLSRWAHRLYGLQQRAVDAAEAGDSATASACMEVHDWLAAMVFDDAEADGE